MPVLRLAIPTPLRRLFDYLPPAEASARPRPGVRVRAPFGHREMVGVLVALPAAGELQADELKAALEVLDEDPLLPPELLQLCQWAADYYQHPPGEVLAAAFTAGLRRGRAPASLGRPAWRLTERGMGLPEGALRRSPKQAEALALLRGGSPRDAASLAEAGIRRGILRSLEEKGLVTPCEVTPAGTMQRRAGGPALNADQLGAVRGVLEQRDTFSCHLLEGVTGSGKTEVYLQLIEHCLAEGGQALVLVPEIGLSPQTLQRFRERFDTPIEVMHSGLSEGPRERAWEAARRGVARIVIGTRSAIFTPLQNPGLIIVDEEHDTSYKQQDGFRYSARDVAVKRAQLIGCPVVLGSATPCLETLHNARRGRYHHHHLPQRAGKASLPQIRCLDVRREPLTAGCAPALIDAVDACLDRRQQVLLFLNRRGFAPSLQCHDCGWIAECRHCDARLTVHLARRQLRCHHCGDARPLPPGCPDCHSRQLLTAGVGTEQLESRLRERFPGTPLHRVDSDSMQARDAMQALAAEVNRGEPCILLGTQMLTKGHHFPGVALVAVIDADALLFSSDFRGEERMAQLLTQVAGRAGRAEAPGEVILQTHHPDHPAMQAMLHESYTVQASRLLEQRRASGLPPYGHLVMLRCDCEDAGGGENFLLAVRQVFEREPPPGCQLIGPLPSPMPRRQGRHRSQLLLTARNRAAARAGAAALVAAGEQQPRRKGLNWSIDVDPAELG